MLETVQHKFSSPLTIAKTSSGASKTTHKMYMAEVPSQWLCVPAGCAASPNSISQPFRNSKYFFILKTI